MREDMAVMERRLSDQITAVETRLTQQLKTIGNTTARMYNHGCRDGSENTYQVVLAPDGRHPVNDLDFPPLRTAENICTLSSNDLTEYNNLYYPDDLVPHNLLRRKKKIGAALGLSRIAIGSLH